ncbi:MAG: carboxypeptidase regulatory-like domain-containing protein [Terriglobales bacterium]
MLLGLVAPAQLAAQATPALPNVAAQIRGRVEVDGLAVPGVTITLTDPVSGQRYVTSTDESGRFTARVAHPGEFDLQAAMMAFAPLTTKVTVPASGAAVPPLELSLVLASQSAARAATARPAPLRRREGAQPARRGASSAGGANRNYQQLDISQTGEITGSADAGAADSGVAGMSDAAATDSAVVVGTASQDDTPMNANAIRSLLRANGGVPGAPTGGGFGGRGGFRGGGGGLGGRGGNFNFRAFQNRFNQPHGSLSYSLADSALNALPDSINGTSATANPPNAADQSFSASVSTPLVIPHLFNDHGKTNLFFSYSGQHNANLSTVSALVPTLNERQGNFQGVTDRAGNPVTVTNPKTGQPYANDAISPGDIASAATALLAYIPLPTPGAAGAFNYSNTVNSLAVTNRLAVRINHSFGAAPAGGGRGFFGRRGRSLNFSINYEGGHSDQPGVFYPYIESLNRTRGMNIRLGYNQPLFGWTNLFSVTYNRNRVDAANLYANLTDVAGQAGIQGVDTDPNAWGVPTLKFTTSGLTSLSDIAPNFVRADTTSISDGMIRRKGRHNVRFGGDMRWLQSNPDTDPDPRGVFSFDGQYSGYDFSDFLLGLPQQTSERFGGGVFYFRQVEPDFYFNDNWQMLGSLTLNYGVRWEYISPYRELDNRLTNLLVSPGFDRLTPVVAGQSGVPDTIVQPEYGHFRPTLGFAWRSWANMIVTGGFGMAYNTGAYSNLATALAYQSPFITNQANLGTATAPLSLTQGFAGTSTAVNTYGVNPDYQVGYSYLWDVDVQRTFASVYVVNLDYSGARGEHLDQLLAPNRTPTGLLYPSLPPFLYDTTGGQSSYNGGSLIVSRRLSQSVSFRATYTYSKMMDDASQIGGGGGQNGLIAQNPLDLDSEWALSNGNQTQRFNTSYEWQLPYGLNHRWGDSSSFWSSALGDWQFSGSLTLDSGQPVTPLVSNVYSNAQGVQALGVSAPLRADLTGEPLTQTAPTLTGFFNTAAFAAPAAGAYGTAGRNVIIGPGQIMFDTALSKTFRMGEFRSMEIRFSGNNVLNHPNWSGLDTNLSSLTFGDITSFGSPRQITFTARYRF